MKDAEVSLSLFKNSNNRHRLDSLWLSCTHIAKHATTRQYKLNMGVQQQKRNSSGAFHYTSYIFISFIFNQTGLVSPLCHVKFHVCFKSIKMGRNYALIRMLIQCHDGQKDIERHIRPGQCNHDSNSQANQPG